MKSGKLLGISAMYNFRVDPYLGIRKISIRIIPYDYDGCLEQLNAVWKTTTNDKEQRRYTTSTRCKIIKKLRI